MELRCGSWWRPKAARLRLAQGRGAVGGCLNGVSGDVVYMHITRRINCVHQWHSPLPWTNARSYSIGDHRGSCAQHVMNARTRGLQR
jgi:hypothetical protein